MPTPASECKERLQERVPQRKFSWRATASAAASCSACTSYTGADTSTSSYCIERDDNGKKHCKPLEERCSGYDDACALVCEIGCFSTPHHELHLCVFDPPSPPSAPLPAPPSPPPPPPAPLPPPLSPPLPPPAPPLFQQLKHVGLLEGVALAAGLCGIALLIITRRAARWAWARWSHDLLQRIQSCWRRAHVSTLVPTADEIAIDFVDGGGSDVNPSATTAGSKAAAESHAESHAGSMAGSLAGSAYGSTTDRSVSYPWAINDNVRSYPREHDLLAGRRKGESALGGLEGGGFEDGGSDEDGSTVDSEIDVDTLFGPTQAQSKAAAAAIVAKAAAAAAAAIAANPEQQSSTNWLSRFGLSTDAARDLWLRTTSSSQVGEPGPGATSDRAADAPGAARDADAEDVGASEAVDDWDDVSPRIERPATMD